MPRASREQAARTGEAILRAAITAFAGQGYAAVALESVAVAASVTRGALYHRYADKRALFLAVLAQVSEQVARRIEQAAGDGDLLEQLERGGEEFIRAAVEPGVRRILLVDGPAVAGWDAWRELDARHSRRTLEEAMLEADAAGRLAGLEPQAVAVLLSGALNDAALWAADQQDVGVAIAQAAAGHRRMVRALVD